MAGKSCTKHTLVHHQTPSFPRSWMLWSMSTTCTTRQKPMGTARTHNRGCYQRIFLSWVHFSSHHPIFTSKGGMQEFDIWQFDTRAWLWQAWLTDRWCRASTTSRTKKSEEVERSQLWGSCEVTVCGLCGMGSAAHLEKENPGLWLGAWLTKPWQIF